MSPLPHYHHTPQAEGLYTACELQDPGASCLISITIPALGAILRSFAYWNFFLAPNHILCNKLQKDKTTTKEKKKRAEAP